jgi:hypothetical protein
MLLVGCLIAFGVAVAPRLVLILAWIFSDRWNVVWGNWVVPLLGIIFAPYTTIMYLLIWSPTGISGFDWLWLALGVLLDVMKWAQIYNNRKGIPGTRQQGAYPGQVPPTAYEAELPREPAQTATLASEPEPAPADHSAELARLSQLHDQGVLTDEEYEAKKQQLAS